MTEAGSVYGQALYDLAKAENLSEIIDGQLSTLVESFRQEPDFLRLLKSPNLSKEEKCQVIDRSFQQKCHPYVVNFLKILVEKGRISHFFDCFTAYREQYYCDHNILPVTAITAVAMRDTQLQRLGEKLTTLTGKQIALTNRVNAEVLGGVRLDYDGTRLDDTVAHRLSAIRTMLNSQVL